jgi:hypothetical protein
MTNKEQVLQIYPDAILLHDLHNFGSQEGGKFNLMIINNLPDFMKEKIVNNVVIIDSPFNCGDFLHPFPLSIWCKTEEECWKDAWFKIQQRMIRTLEDERKQKSVV